MTKGEARQRAIHLVKGQYITPGTPVGSEHDPRTWEFIESVDGVAVCRINEEIKSFPRGDIFDINKVVNVTRHLLNLGFWREGMESVVVKIIEA